MQFIYNPYNPRYLAWGYAKKVTGGTIYQAG